MKKRFKKAGAVATVTALLVIGGGFASADYQEGDVAATASATVTYTVASFRALELIGTTVAFGTIRQGAKVTQAGPTLLYGTTWSGDKISAYLNAAMANNVLLYVLPAAPAMPEDSSACVSPGVTASSTPSLGVQITATSSSAPQPIITGIVNCGYPAQSMTSSPYPTGTPILSKTSTSWASAATQLVIDTSSATDSGTPGALASPQSKTLYFVIND